MHTADEAKEQCSSSKINKRKINQTNETKYMKIFNYFCATAAGFYFYLLQILIFQVIEIFHLPIVGRCTKLKTKNEITQN